MKNKQELKNLIYVEPSTASVRPYLIDYVLLLCDQATKMSKNNLLNGAGRDIAIDITSAIAWQDAEGVNNNGWFNKNSEPLLTQILEVSGRLDADSSSTEHWMLLLDLVAQLK